MPKQSPTERARAWAVDNLEEDANGEVHKGHMCGWNGDPSTALAKSHLKAEYGGHSWKTVSKVARGMWPGKVALCRGGDGGREVFLAGVRLRSSPPSSSSSKVRVPACAFAFFDLHLHSGLFV